MSTLERVALQVINQEVDFQHERHSREDRGTTRQSFLACPFYVGRYSPEVTQEEEKPVQWMHLVAVIVSLVRQDTRFRNIDHTACLESLSDSEAREPSVDDSVSYELARARERRERQLSQEQPILHGKTHAFTRYKQAKQLKQAHGVVYTRSNTQKRQLYGMPQCKRK